MCSITIETSAKFTIENWSVHVIGIKYLDPVALWSQKCLDFCVLVHATRAFVPNGRIRHEFVGSVFLQRIAGISTDNGVFLWILVHMSLGNHNCTREAQEVLVLDLNELNWKLTNIGTDNTNDILPWSNCHLVCSEMKCDPACSKKCCEASGRHQLDFAPQPPGLS